VVEERDGDVNSYHRRGLSCYDFISLCI